MTTKQQILAEIERMLDDTSLYRNLDQRTGGSVALARLHSFLNTLPDEPVTDCHDLEEAKEEYLRKARRTPGHEWMTRDIEEAFKAGAEWHKRKMMEGAVAVEVIGEKRDLRLIDSTQRCLFDAKRGDWQKIIIVKEKEQ